MWHHKKQESHGASSMAWPENRAMTQDRSMGEAPRKVTESAVSVQRQSHSRSLIAYSLRTSQVSVLVLVHELLNKLVPLKLNELFFLMQAKPN